jgi:hypothetical protein
VWGYSKSVEILSDIWRNREFNSVCLQAKCVIPSQSFETKFDSAQGRVEEVQILLRAHWFGRVHLAEGFAKMGSKIVHYSAPLRTLGILGGITAPLRERNSSANPHRIE